MKEWIKQEFQSIFCSNKDVEQNFPVFKNPCPLLRNIKIFPFSLMLLKFQNKSSIFSSLNRSNGIWVCLCSLHMLCSAETSVLLLPWQLLLSCLGLHRVALGQFPESQFAKSEWAIWPFGNWLSAIWQLAFSKVTHSPSQTENYLVSGRYLICLPSRTLPKLFQTWRISSNVTQKRHFQNFFQPGLYNSTSWKLFLTSTLSLSCMLFFKSFPSSSARADGRKSAWSSAQ